MKTEQLKRVLGRDCNVVFNGIERNLPWTNFLVDAGECGERIFTFYCWRSTESDAFFATLYVGNLIQVDGTLVPGIATGCVVSCCCKQDGDPGMWVLSIKFLVKEVDQNHVSITGM